MVLAGLCPICLPVFTPAVVSIRQKNDKNFNLREGKEIAILSCLVATKLLYVIHWLLPTTPISGVIVTGPVAV